MDLDNTIEPEKSIYKRLYTMFKDSITESNISISQFTFNDFRIYKTQIHYLLFKLHV